MPSCSPRCTGWAEVTAGWRGSALEVGEPFVSPLEVGTRSARDKVGLPNAHVHDLRHAGLTLVAQAGATTREIIARGGHSMAHASLIYQHAAESRGSQIAASMTLVAQADRGTS